MNIISHTSIIKGHDYKFHLDIISSYPNDIVVSSQMIINEFNDRIKYCQPMVNSFDIVKNEMIGRSNVPSLIRFNTYKEVVDFLDSKKYIFYFVKVVVDINGVWNISAHIQDNLPNLREIKLNQILDL